MIGKIDVSPGGEQERIADSAFKSSERGPTGSSGVKFFSDSDWTRSALRPLV